MKLSNNAIRFVHQINAPNFAIFLNENVRMKERRTFPGYRKVAAAEHVSGETYALYITNHIQMISDEDWQTASS